MLGVLICYWLLQSVFYYDHLLLLCHIFYIPLPIMLYCSNIYILYYNFEYIIFKNYNFQKVFAILDFL